MYIKLRKQFNVINNIVKYLKPVTLYELPKTSQLVSFHPSLQLLEQKMFIFVFGEYRFDFKF